MKLSISRDQLVSNRASFAILFLKETNTNAFSREIRFFRHD